MTGLLLILPILSLLTLAAHFFRAGNLLFVGFSLAALWLLSVRRSWAARVVQVVLVLAAAEWVRTALRIYDVRRMMGEPATRMLIILGSVALVALVSAALFETRRLKRFYR